MSVMSWLLDSDPAAKPVRRAIDRVRERNPFDMGPGVGRARGWITMRALRVLKWYGARAGARSMSSHNQD